MRAKTILGNIALTVMFAFIASVLGVRLYCQDNYVPSCRNGDLYTLIPLMVIFLIFVTYFLTQHFKTHNLLRPRRRAMPITARQEGSGVMQSVVKLFGGVGTSAGTFFSHALYGLPDQHGENMEMRELTPRMTDEGWRVDFEDGNPVLVSKREFYYWLLKVIKIQQDLEAEKKDRTVSPVGFRKHPDIGRRRHKAYVTLLQDANALIPINRNVSKLRHTKDPWSEIILPLDKIKEIVQF